MKLYVVSDLHLEYGDFDVPDVDADVVVVAGDLHVGTRGLSWAAERLPDVPIVYVLGNHEYYQEVMPDLIVEMRDEAERIDERIHVLDRAAVEIDDVVFLGATLWTDFGFAGDPTDGMRIAHAVLTDFRQIHFGPEDRPLEPTDLASVHERELWWLEQSFDRAPAKRTVVVTHHPPAARSVPASVIDDAWAGVYASRLGHVVERSGATLWIHGHVHTPADYTIGSTRVLSNPRGYINRGRRSHPRFRPDLVVDV